MGRKVALTPASIDALHKGSLADLLTPGLAIEVLASGKGRWRFRRLVAGTKTVVTMFGGLFPARTIADAREWARGLNEKIEAGIDPREVLRHEKARAAMTVARAHELYLVAVREGRAAAKWLKDREFRRWRQSPSGATRYRSRGILEPKLNGRNWAASRPSAFG